MRVLDQYPRTIGKTSRQLKLSLDDNPSVLHFAGVRRYLELLSAKVASNVIYKHIVTAGFIFQARVSSGQHQSHRSALSAITPSSLIVLKCATTESKDPRLLHFASTLIYQRCSPLHADLRSGDKRLFTVHVLTNLVCVTP